MILSIFVRLALRGDALRQRLHRAGQRDRGSHTVEFAIIAVGAAVVAISVFAFLGPYIQRKLASLP